MIIHRQVWWVTPGTVDQHAKAIREEDDAVRASLEGDRTPVRIYAPFLAPHSVIAMEWTAESLQAMAEGWEAWDKTGRVPAFFARNERLSRPDSRSTHTDWQVIAHHEVDGAENGIAVRWLWHALSYKDHALAKLLDDWVVKGSQYTARLMRPMHGDPSDVALEIEYADLADFTKGFSVWSSQPDIQDFYDEFNTYTKPGGSTDVWWLSS